MRPFRSCVLSCLVTCVILVLTSRIASAGHYALLIGVSQYDKGSGLQDLDFTNADILEFDKVLTKLGYKTQRILNDPSPDSDSYQIPTHDYIERGITRFLADRFESDSVILAFAGHGVHIDGESYICPRDTVLRERRNLISVDWIHERLAECKATQITFFCDACQEELFSNDITLGAQSVEAGVGETTQRDLDAMMAKYLSESKNGINQRKLTVVQSCSPKQFARADRALGHSVFFHYLIEGFQGAADQDGNGHLEHEELIKYVAVNVRDFVSEKYHDSQIVYGAITGNSDIPLMVFDARPTWMPADCVPTPDSRLVELPGFEPIRLYSQITLRPQRKTGDQKQPWRTSDGTEMSIELRLVPQLQSGDPPSFYIMRDKVTAGQFRAFEANTSRPLDADAQALRQQSDRESGFNADRPAFLVTGLEAIEFADEVAGGKLPTPQQWDAAFGRFYKQALAAKVKYPVWSARDARHPEWAIDRSDALPVDRDETPDQSPWGVRDMGGNGMELTRFDGDWFMMIPHQHEPSSMVLRGRSYREKSPLTVLSWVNAGVPDDIFFGTQGVRSPAADVSFRVVIEQPQP